MYEATDERVCTLGLPTGNWKKSGQGRIEAWENPAVSKVGGYAIWHDSNTAPKEVDVLVCGNCTKSDEIVLVSQVYAPTELERSLYVFCCNRRECSLSSKGWIIIRNQALAKDKEPASNELKQSEVIQEVSSPVAKAGDATPKKSSVWDFLSEDTTDGNKNDEDDLLSLLANRNLNIGSSSAKKPSSVTTPTKATTQQSSSEHSILITKKALPVCQLREEDEDWDFALDEDDNDAVFGDGVDQSHIDSLLSSYLKDEDDAENLLALQSHGIGSGIVSNVISNHQSADDEDEQIEARNVEVETKKPGSKSKKNDDDDDFGEDKLSHESSKHRTEQYFQRRVSLYPNQILRYAYEGTPLWISSPSPLESISSSKRSSKSSEPNSIIGNCECCGAQRVFEFQLMPSLLSLISKHLPKSNTKEVKSKETSKAQQSSKPDVNDILGDTMDFGVVTVWTCPNSCESSNGQLQKEVAIVQPPSDFL